jgi:hypothetical protein
MDAWEVRLRRSFDGAWLTTRKSSYELWQACDRRLVDWLSVPAVYTLPSSPRQTFLVTTACARCGAAALAVSDGTVNTWMSNRNRITARSRRCALERPSRQTAIVHGRCPFIVAETGQQ